MLTAFTEIITLRGRGILIRSHVHFIKALSFLKKVKWYKFNIQKLHVM